MWAPEHHSRKQSSAPLLHLPFFGHRARRVDYEHDVLRRVFLVGPVFFRRDHQQEITLLARLAMCQQRESEIFFRNGVEELKVLRFLPASGFKRNDRTTITIALHLERVSG